MVVKSTALEGGETLQDLLEATNFEGFGDNLKACFANIPYQWHIIGDFV